MNLTKGMYTKKGKYEFIFNDEYLYDPTFDDLESKENQLETF